MSIGYARAYDADFSLFTSLCFLVDRNTIGQIITVVLYCRVVTVRA